MAPEREDTPSFHDYRELWNFTLQKMEHIQGSIENSISDLEKHYAEFESRYGEILEQVDILTSLYSSFNAIEGGESLLRLRAILESYKKRYTREGLDFNLVHRLLLKIAESRNRSFEDFPRLTHHDAATVVAGADEGTVETSLRRCRWITFKRNRSWFISPFRSIRILSGPDISLQGVEEPDMLVVGTGSEAVAVRDLLARSIEAASPPRHVILLDGGSRNYAADLIGKRIFADRDFITPLLVPFRKAPHNTLSPGRVRLFGKRHLLLGSEAEAEMRPGAAGPAISGRP